MEFAGVRIVVAPGTTLAAVAFVLAGVRIVVAPGTTLAAVAFVLAGVALGTVSGLTPGLHANNFALLLAAVAPSIHVWENLLSEQIQPEFIILSST